MMGAISLVIVLFTNIWLWKVAGINPLVALIMVVTSIVLFKSLKQGRIARLLIPLVLVMFIFEYNTTSIKPLTVLGNQEKINQRLYLDAYPPVYLKIANRYFYIPAAHWLEERKEIIIVYRVKQHIGEALNLNLYFFGNHPNERVGIKEFEKFPYILFPFFVTGFFTLDYKKNKKAIILSVLLPIFLIMLIGTDNTMGPFIMFPIIVSLIVFGIEYVFKYLSKSRLGSWLIYFFCTVYFVVLAQTILYEIF